MRESLLMNALAFAMPSLFCAETSALAAEGRAIHPATVGAVAATEQMSQLAEPQLDDLQTLISPLPTAELIYTHVNRNGIVTTSLVAADAEANTIHKGTPGERLIYSNTNGNKVLRIGVPNRPFGDDIGTNAGDGCQLTRYLVRVNGGVQGGTGTFSCKVSLWDRCPETQTGSLMILGTEADFTGLTDDSTSFHDLILDLSDSSITIPPNFWIRLEFDTSTAGWVGATYPEVGFSTDKFYYRTTGCYSYLGPAFTSSFFAQFYVNDNPGFECSAQFRTYDAEMHGPYTVSNPAGQLLADDFRGAYDISNSSCILAGYEVGIRGNAGPYNITIDLREPFSDTAIPGTAFTHQGLGSGALELVRHWIPAEIEVPVEETLWVTWVSNKHNTGLVSTRFAEAGYSASEYYQWSTTTAPPSWVSLSTAPADTAYLVVYCRGEEPDGACCYHNGVPHACLDDMPLTSCGKGRWLFNETCAADAFDPPCGTHLCCLPGDECADLNQLDCANGSGVWKGGTFCSIDANLCRHYACLVSTEPCTLSHDSPGCNNRFCCEPVCDINKSCCTDSWSHQCIQVDRNHCGCDSLAPGEYCAPFTSQSNVNYPGSQLVTANQGFSIDTCTATTGQIREYCCAPPLNYVRGEVFFRFVATETSARIHTCNTSPGEAGDSVLQFYQVGDPTTETTACSSLTALVCNDDAPGCGAQGKMSDLCVTDLIPGETYYFTLGSKAVSDQGIYRVGIESPCPSTGPVATCHGGEVQWLHPHAGEVVDARQPFDPSDPATFQGIMAVKVQAPVNADDPACWSFCDTVGNPLSNSVIAIDNHGDGTHTLHLEWPLIPTSESRLTYMSGSSCAGTTGVFQFLPADVDFSGYVDAVSDAAWFQQCCLSIAGCGTVEFCDTNHSAEITTEDLIRLLDLFNGAGPFDPWNGQQADSGACE